MPGRCIQVYCTVFCYKLSESNEKKIGGTLGRRTHRLRNTALDD